MLSELALEPALCRVAKLVRCVSLCNAESLVLSTLKHRRASKQRASADCIHRISATPLPEAKMYTRALAGGSKAQKRVMGK